MKQFPILYSRTVTGAIQTWFAETEGGKYRTINGQEPGQKTISEWSICFCKNEGKANETTAEEQAEKEVQSLYKKKLKTGYFEKIEDIDNFQYIQPMLAKKFTDYQDDISYPVAIEPKLNGVCCIREKRGGFSRKGEKFFCIEHILKETEFLFQQFPGLVLHGELFNFEYKNLLNRITSLVSVNRKEKDVSEIDREESKRIIKLYVYDGYGANGVDEETPFKDRKKMLKSILQGLNTVKVLDYCLAHSLSDVEAALKKTRERKEEGIMIKLLHGKYEHKRSKSILKLKNFIDEEFEIVGFVEGTGNWTGCVKKVTCRLKVKTLDGRDTFESNIRGTMQELATLLKEQSKHVGKLATVTYQEKSEYGVPLIAYTSLPFRDYE